MKTVEQLLQYAKVNKGQVLRQISDSVSLDCELLLSFCLQKPRSYLHAWPDAKVSDAVYKQFCALLLRREQGEPVAYLTGKRGFWSLDLQVNSSTLIPRPETELLVEIALQLLADKNQARVLDLGTGTGAIALALAAEKPQWQVFACDCQQAAVALAEKNKQTHSLHNVHIFQSDWFNNVSEYAFDLIVSNPPYIDGTDPHLEQDGVRFEPRSALVAANHGLADIKRIIQQSQPFLAQGAWLLLEHGYDQANAVKELLLFNGFQALFCHQDLAGIDRVSGGRV